MIGCFLLKCTLGVVFLPFSFYAHRLVPLTFCQRTRYFLTQLFICRPDDSSRSSSSLYKTWRTPTVSHRTPSTQKMNQKQLVWLHQLFLKDWKCSHPGQDDGDNVSVCVCVCVFKEPTCCVDNVEAGSLAGSPSLAAVLPNSRHPGALWDSGLGSLDFLENRLLKERHTEWVSSLHHMVNFNNIKLLNLKRTGSNEVTHNYNTSFLELVLKNMYSFFFICPSKLHWTKCLCKDLTVKACVQQDPEAAYSPCLSKLNSGVDDTISAGNHLHTGSHKSKTWKQKSKRVSSTATSGKLSSEKTFHTLQARRKNSQSDICPASPGCTFPPLVNVVLFVGFYHWQRHWLTYYLCVTFSMFL